MSAQVSLVRNGSTVQNRLLELDNNIIGLFVGTLAALDWINFFGEVTHIRLYFSLGILSVKPLSMLTLFASAIYLTFSAIILISLPRPTSRSHAILPNLIAVLAAFSVYLFALVPAGGLFGISVSTALSLTLLGTSLVIVSMFYLGRAFTVTPQARFLVTAGPYHFVRHPMYVGNILSLLGVALLLDSWQAILLFLICAILQVVRAHCDEIILQDTFPEYADYKTKVGRFIPRVHANGIAVTIVFATILCSFNSQDAVAFTVLAPQKTDGLSLLPFVLVAGVADEWAPRCESWTNSLAQPGVWLNSDQIKKADDAINQGMLKSIDKCKNFIALWTKCKSYESAWDRKNVGDAAFVMAVEGLGGCEAMVGIEKMCMPLENMAYGGTVLTPPQLAVITQCFTLDLKKNPILVAIRPAM